MTFRQAAPLYLEYAEKRKKPSTFESDVYRLRAILRATWTGNYLGNVTALDLTRWAEERRSEVSGSSVNRDQTLISALYRWAQRMGYSQDNPARQVERFSEKGRERETYLTAEESRALVGVASEMIRPLLVCALSTGMRRGELLALDWRDVDFQRGELILRAAKEKAGRGRVIPMTDTLASELRSLHDGRKVRKIDGTVPVFTLRDGGRLNAYALRRSFASAVERCDTIPEGKKPKVAFHCLRHTAASLMVQAGVSIPEVAKVLGHSTLAVTMRYAHFAPEAGRAAVDRLGRALDLGGDHGPAEDRAERA